MTANNQASPDVPLSLQDFETSGWEEAFRGSRSSACIASALQKQEQKAVREGRIAQSRVLRLLTDACSMMLCPSSVNEPFQPYVRTRAGRSAVLDDYSEQDIDYFQLILPSVTNPWLKARLADLVWLRRRRKTELGLMAIDAYVKTPLTLESFVGDGRDCWIRAIQLTGMLKDVAGERAKEIEDKILGAYRLATGRDGFLGERLADLLKGFGFGDNHENEIGEKLVALADVFKLQKDYHRARAYFGAASYWLNKAEKVQESFRAIACQAEIWEIEATSREAGGDFMGAADCLEKAIQTYHQIPKRHRAALGTEKKSSQLQAQLSRTGQQASASMTLFSSPRVDISEMVIEARRSIRGKEPLEALKTLVNLYPGTRTTQARIKAEQELAEFHFSTFFPLIVRSHDGRVVAKRPGMADATKDSEAHKAAVWHEMIRNYLLEIGVVIMGRIVPALEVMIAEHRLSEEDFISLCSQSSIVPPSRVRAFGKALFAGYDFDFDSAIHRLVPQMENMVRFHLKTAGVVTVVPDSEGIQSEVNLGKLLDKPEATAIFGEDLIFEMKILFCEGSGPNFRHGLAHGLLEDRDFQSAAAVYAWCFVLRVVLNPFWNPCAREQLLD